MIQEVPEVAGEPRTVFVIDDDSSVREALVDLLGSVGLDAQAFASPRAFMSARRPDRPSCLVLDIRMPGANGLDFQRELIGLNILIPLIFISGHADIQMSVRAMKDGAIEFLTKPFRDQDLLDAINEGLNRDAARRREAEAISDLRARFDALDDRDQAIMAQVVQGHLNKQIAATFGLSEITIKVRRARIMRRMNARSLSDLVRMTERLRLYQ